MENASSSMMRKTFIIVCLTLIYCLSIFRPNHKVACLMQKSTHKNLHLLLNLMYKRGTAKNVEQYFFHQVSSILDYYRNNHYSMSVGVLGNTMCRQKVFVRPCVTNRYEP